MQVNNANAGFAKLALDHSLDDVELVFRGGYQASLHFSQLAHPYLKASGAGNLIFVTSIAGSLRFMNTVAYSSGKGKPG